MKCLGDPHLNTYTDFHSDWFEAQTLKCNLAQNQVHSYSHQIHQVLRVQVQERTCDDEDDDTPKIKDMTTRSFHSCRQDETHVIDIKFRNKIKDMALRNYKFNYARTFTKEKKDLLKNILDNDLQERVRS